MVSSRLCVSTGALSDLKTLVRSSEDIRPTYFCHLGDHAVGSQDAVRGSADIQPISLSSLCATSQPCSLFAIPAWAGPVFLCFLVCFCFRRVSTGVVAESHEFLETSHTACRRQNLLVPQPSLSLPICSWGFVKTAELRSVAVASLIPRPEAYDVCAARPFDFVSKHHC